MSKEADVRCHIVAAIDKILTGSGRTTRPFADDEGLTDDMGLDSLDLAVLVVSLEQQLGVDPFRNDSAAVRSLADLVDIYMSAVES